MDHDHSCCPVRGRTCGACIRGLLCHRCNLAIGQLRDSADLARSAAFYLDKFSGA